jgi:hypothetical protein
MLGNHLKNNSCYLIEITCTSASLPKAMRTIFNMHVVKYVVEKYTQENDSTPLLIIITGVKITSLQK